MDMHSITWGNIAATVFIQHNTRLSVHTNIMKCLPMTDMINEQMSTRWIVLTINELTSDPHCSVGSMLNTLNRDYTKTNSINLANVQDRLSIIISILYVSVRRAGYTTCMCRQVTGC